MKYLMDLPTQRANRPNIRFNLRPWEKERFYSKYSFSLRSALINYLPWNLQWDLGRRMSLLVMHFEDLPGLQTSFPPYIVVSRYVHSVKFFCSRISEHFKCMKFCDSAGRNIAQPSWLCRCNRFSQTLDVKKPLTGSQCFVFLIPTMC